jgi:hypothetical protein
MKKKIIKWSAYYHNFQDVHSLLDGGKVHSFISSNFKCPVVSQEPVLQAHQKKPHKSDGVTHNHHPLLQSD